MHQIALDAPQAVLDAPVQLALPSCVPHQPHRPLLTSFELRDGADPSELLRGLNDDISPSLSITASIRFSGKMQGISAASLGATGDTAGLDASVSAPSSPDGLNFVFPVSLGANDVRTTLSMALNAPSAPFSWPAGPSGSTNAFRVAIYDVTPPILSLKDTDFFLLDGIPNQVLDIPTTVINTVSDNVSPVARLTVRAMSAPDVSDVLSLTHCSGGTYSAGCTISGAGSSSTIGPDKTGVSEITLSITDEAGNSATMTFSLVRQAVITFTAAQVKLTKFGHFAPFNHPPGTSRRFEESLSDICTSSSGPGDIVVTVAIGGSLASKCSGPTAGAKQSESPKIECTFDGPGSVSWTVTCTESLGINPRHVDVAPTALIRSWSIAEQLPPSLSTTGSFLFVENGVPKALGDALTISLADSEDANLRLATITSTKCVVGKERLGVQLPTPASLSTTVSSNGCLVTIVPSGGVQQAPLAHFLTAIRAVTFVHLSDNPSQIVGVSLTLSVTDDAGGEDGTPDSYALSSSTTVDFAVQELDDALVVLVSAASINSTAMSRDSTPLHVRETPRDGACLLDAQDNPIEIIIEDVDVIQAGPAGSGAAIVDNDDIQLDIIAWPGALDMPDTEMWSVVSLTDAILSPTSVTGASFVPGASEQVVYRKYGICVTARGTDGSAGVRRQTWQTLDFENLQPSYFSGYGADKKLGLRLRATSPKSQHAREFTLWYFLDDKPDEEPHFFHPEAGAADIEGIFGGVMAIQSDRHFYRAALVPAFTTRVDSLDAASGNVLTDTVQTNIYPAPLFNEAEAFLAVYAPVDFVHSIVNSKAFVRSTVVVDPDMDGELDLSLKFLGEWTKPASGAVPTELLGQETTVEAGTFHTLGGLFASQEGEGFTFRVNDSHIELFGRPSYGPSFNLQRLYPGTRSPSPKRLRFRLVAKNLRTQLTSQREFFLDVEVQGCMDLRGAFMDGPARAFLDGSSPFQLPDKTQLSAYMTADAAGWKNPSGDFNPAATVPSLCTYPPRAVGPASASAFTLQAGRPEATVASLEASLGPAPSLQLVESSRGFVSVEVPPAAVDVAVVIEVAGVTASVVNAVPLPSSDAIVESDLSLKLGPCGQQFLLPVQVCLFVGPQRSGRYHSLLHARAVNCLQPELGYDGFEPTVDNSYDPTTGKVCGRISSFSIVSSVSIPTPAVRQLGVRYLQPGTGCPGECSGRGYCIAYRRCECFQGFTGYDCSLRTCPYAPAWAANSELQRQPEECAGRGACDRTTGLCACQSGFEGGACDRIECPGRCSGHGQCRRLSELASAKDAGYQEWDANRVGACACDPGYTGPSCDERLCPFGSDPAASCNREPSTVKVSLSTPLSLAELVSGSFPSTGAAWKHDSSSLVMQVASQGGDTFVTKPVGPMLGSGALSQTALRAAMSSELKGLPNFLADDSIEVTASGTQRSRDVSLRLVGHRAGGSVLSFACPSPLGCTVPGCRPRYIQPRLSLQQVQSNGVKLRQPLTVEVPPGAAGVAIRVAVAQAVHGSVQIPTFAVQTCSLSVAGAALVESACTGTMGARPIPDTDALLNGVDVGSGVELIFATAAPALGDYNFFFVVGTCGVETSATGQQGTECSGRGLCARGTGLCRCFDDYEGLNCGIAAPSS